MKKFEPIRTLILLLPPRLHRRKTVPCANPTTLEQLRFSIGIIGNVALADVEKADMSPSELVAINFSAGRSTPSRSGQQDYKRFLASVRNEQCASCALYFRDVARKSRTGFSRGGLRAEREPKPTGLIFYFLFSFFFLSTYS
jgi:hypothetical protein